MGIDLGKLNDVYTEKVTGVSAGGTYDELLGLLVPQGYIFEVRHTSIENQTTAYTRLLVGIKEGADFYQKEEEDYPAADNLYWTRSKFIAQPNSRLAARCYGCTSGDVLIMTYEGVLYAAD